MKTQIAVIGGGLAGLALSIDLRKRGFDVLVIEKGNFPRHKVCGEYLSCESWPYLKYLCPALHELDLPSITSLRFTSGKINIGARLTLGGIGISRYLLEHSLYLEGCKIGVEFQLETKVEKVEYQEDTKKHLIHLGSGQVLSDIVCNATGRKSNLQPAGKSRHVNGRNYIGIKYHIEYPRDASLIEMHNFPGGYCGISNIENNMSSLCYMANSESLRKFGSIENLQNGLLSLNPELKKIFTNATFLNKEPLTISGIDFTIKQAVVNKVYYLGDAAGSVAPITGNGMSMALRSAWFLAHEIAGYYNLHGSRTRLETNYKRWWTGAFSSKITRSRSLQRMSESALLTNLLIMSCKVVPGLTKSIIRTTHGLPFGKDQYLVSQDL